MTDPANRVTMAAKMPLPRSSDETNGNGLARRPPLPRMSLDGEPLASRLLIGLAVLLGLGLVACFLACAFLRVSFPFDIEWMEGGMITHAARLLEGQPIYGPPSTSFVAFFYAPFYARLLAFLARLVGGLSFALGRSVSIAATLAIFVMLFYAARRQAGLRAGLLAVGLYAALFRTCGAFYDLARVDSLALCLGLAGVLAGFYARTSVGLAVAAVLSVLACFTKQTSVIPALFLGLYLLKTNFRRALVFGLLCLGMGAALGWLESRASSGWFRFYVVQGHQGHRFLWGHLLLTYWRDLLFLCPFVILLPTYGVSHDKRLRILSWALVGLLGAAFLQRVSTLDYAKNVFYRDVWYEKHRWALLVPPCAMTALLLVARRVTRSCRSIPAHFFAWMVLAGALTSDINHSTRYAYNNCFMPVAAYASLYSAILVARLVEASADLRIRARFAGVPIGLVLLIQFAALAYDPRAQIPDLADEMALERFNSKLAEYPGPVLASSHPLYSYLRSRTIHLHHMGLLDVAFAGGVRDLHDALANGRYPTVVTDTSSTIRHLAKYYAPSYEFEYAGNELYPRTGHLVRPEVIWTLRANAPERAPY